jgi:hypothetical protein
MNWIAYVFLTLAGLAIVLFLKPRILDGLRDVIQDLSPPSGTVKTSGSWHYSKATQGAPLGETPTTDERTDSQPPTAAYLAYLSPGERERAIRSAAHFVRHGYWADYRTYYRPWRDALRYDANGVWRQTANVVAPVMSTPSQESAHSREVTRLLLAQGILSVNEARRALGLSESDIDEAETDFRPIPSVPQHPNCTCGCHTGGTPLHDLNACSECIAEWMDPKEQVQSVPASAFLLDAKRKITVKENP